MKQKLLMNFCSDKFRYLAVGTLMLALASPPIKAASIPEAFWAVQQSRIITGTISGNDGETLPGVNILVKGTNTGTVTDAEGKYSLSVPSEDVILVMSSIGYVTQEVALNGRSVIEVTLVEDVQNLDEIVVVGYGVQKKESVIGAISQISTESLTRSGTDNVSNAIAGKLSGVMTIQNTGEPGDNHSEIIIRGLSSWSGSEPLVMVDGVERDFRFLNPNEIETISVLKDASATAVYGARGANGVILVTTRRGSKQKPELSFKASTGLQLPSGMDYFIDSYTTMSMLQVARMNDQQFDDRLPESIINEYRNPSTRLNSLRYPNVNFFEEVTRPFAPISTANVSVVGGTDFVKYFAALGYQHEGGLFSGVDEGHIDSRYKNNRFNYRANLDFALTSSTNLTFNIGGDISAKNNPENDSWEALANTGPARFPAYFPAWVLEEIPDPYYPDAKGKRLAMAFGERYDNPYSYFNDGAFRNYTSSRVFTDLAFGQKLDFLVKGLSVKGKVSLSTYYNMRTKYSDTRLPQYYLHYDLIGTEQNPWERVDETLDVYNIPPINVNTGGLEVDPDDPNFYTDLYYEASINYANSFGGGKHNVSALALFNRQQKDVGLEFPFYNEAWVGRVTYDYQLKYLVEVNMGYTGSERFSPNNRFGFFPSGALGWVISEESFFQDAVPWMNTLKLRYSDGLVGSDHAESRWLYVSEFYTDDEYIAEDIGANVNAQWEEARKRDIGLEVGLFNNMFRFTVDFYDEYRTNMLLEPQNETFFLGTSFKDLNRGELKKHGFEVEAQFNRTTNFGLSYNVKGMLGFSENRIIYKDDLAYAPDYRKYAGKQLGMPEGERTPGAAGVLLVNSEYLTTVDDIHNHSLQAPPNVLNVGDHVFLDYDVDGAITGRDKYPVEGSQYAPIVYSMSGGLTFKRWGLNVMFQGNKGKYVVYNNVFENEFELGSYSVRPTQINYWTPDRQAEANHATLHYFDGGGGIPQYAWAGGASLEGYDIRTPGHFWRKADYLRLKEVHLEYNINQSKLLGHIGISDLTIYAQGYNLLTFTDLILGDPERKDFTRGFYPMMKVVKVGINASF